MPNGLALAIVLLVIMLFAAYGVSLLLNFLTPFYTTPKKIAKDIIKLFDLKDNSSFADLGSGDGRMVFETYKMYKCNSVGYEISPVLLILVKIKKLFLFPFNKKIDLKEESFFKADLSKYNVLYCCLPQDVLDILEDKFGKELKENTKVFVYRGKLKNKKGRKISVGTQEVYQYTF